MSGRRCGGERDIARKLRRQSGEEDEVQPEIQIRQPEPNPVPSVGPKPTLLTAQTPRPFTREPAHHRVWPITHERPVTHIRLETRERPVNPRLLHMRRSLIVPRGTFAAWLRRLNRLGGDSSALGLNRLGSGSSALAAYSARETYFTRPASDLLTRASTRDSCTRVAL